MTDTAALQQTLETLEAIDRRQTFRRFDYFRPYPKQVAFFEMGGAKRERLLTAGNQQGKTEAGAFEATCHMTGEYPKWWTGRRWDRPTRGWLVGETSAVTRDNLQRKLCGEPGVDSEWGTGMIPREALIDRSRAPGVVDAYDTLQVRHVSGGTSVARFKSAEQGRSKFQGETLDWCWNDEEPPMDIYSEELARITATRGMIFTTFTSMMGPTTLVSRFFAEDRPNCGMVQMGLRDALHITPDQYETLINQYLPHERDARINGGIMRGEGRIFLTPEENLMEPVSQRVPEHWVKLWGIDFGIGHPFAAALVLWDRDTDTIHVHDAWRIADALSLVHADYIRRVAGNVPVAWPRDGTERDSHSGDPLAAAYKKHGLRMMPEHATWSDGSLSTYAGVKEMDERMKTGRFKVADHLHDFFEEYRNYHYKDGKINKIKDDILSAVRVAIMMKRFARAVPLGVQVADYGAAGPTVFARGTAGHPDGEIDLFAGA